MADARVLEIPNDRTDTYLNAIRQQIGSQLQLVVTIFPTSRDDRYSALKKLCCIDSPIPSQVFLLNEKAWWAGMIWVGFVIHLKIFAMRTTRRVRVGFYDQLQYHANHK